MALAEVFKHDWSLECIWKSTNTEKTKTVVYLFEIRLASVAC